MISKPAAILRRERTHDDTDGCGYLHASDRIASSADEIATAYCLDENLAGAASFRMYQKHPVNYPRVCLQAQRGPVLLIHLY